MPSPSSSALDIGLRSAGGTRRASRGHWYFERNSSSEERAAPAWTNTETSAAGPTAGGALSASVMNWTPGKQVYGWFLYWHHKHLRAAREQAVQHIVSESEVGVAVRTDEEQ